MVFEERFIIHYPFIRELLILLFLHQLHQVPQFDRYSLVVPFLGIQGLCLSIGHSSSSSTVEQQTRRTTDNSKRDSSAGR